ncbi:amidase [Ochrobactrum sp. Marseille-Q0166]|uniref:amidase n=1 Tax=Ochrobactrum sp. Marseille-Q0166 TaxID=2761105 RepID=UPI001654D227|nr:amidase [Ochrobactrum sp. Marseille-Q0166]MBC8719934.1 amidase [Ochrobactrum sp. Marseille-Q0166]
MQACLIRIERTDPVLQAFLLLTKEDALPAAQQAETEIANGRYRGRLHGIPFAVKDLLDVAGLPTTAGSLHLKHDIPTETATAVERVKRPVPSCWASFIWWSSPSVVGYQCAPRCTSKPLGSVKAPFTRCSSSGSGVAVAAGMVPFSLGSDTGGSIRNPASMNGIVGLKPTQASVSTHGVFPLSQMLDSIGPMARSVEDAANLFDALSGSDERDPATWNTNPPKTLTSLKHSTRGMRVGVVSRAQLPDVETEILDALDASVAVFRQLGVNVVDVKLPKDPVDYCAAASQIIRTEGYANLAALMNEDRGDFDPYVRERILAGKDGSAADFAMRLTKRSAETAEMCEALSGLDALLLPTTPISSPPLSGIDEYAMPLSDLPRFVNYLGLCALALPNGVNPEGMPLSLQIVAPRIPRGCGASTRLSFRECYTLA